MEFSDAQLTTKVQQLFLNISQFVIKIVFNPTEQIILKRKLMDDISDIWGKGGFITKKKKKFDFIIQFVDDKGKMPFLERDRKTSQYILMFKKNLTKQKIKCHYYNSLALIQMLLKEILAYLLKKDGFILHASSCIDNQGKLLVFMAKSGGGKSTTRDMVINEGLEYFSDDMLIIRYINNKWHYFSPPMVEKIFLPKRKISKFAAFFIVKKDRPLNVNQITNKTTALKLTLSQIWLGRGKLDKPTFIRVSCFVNDNNYYYLHRKLNSKGLLKYLNEA